MPTLDPLYARLLVAEFLEASRELEVERRALEDLQRVLSGIEHVTRESLAQELRVRGAQPSSRPYGVADEQRTEISRLRPSWSVPINGTLNGSPPR